MNLILLKEENNSWAKDVNHNEPNIFHSAILRLWFMKWRADNNKYNTIFGFCWL